MSPDVSYPRFSSKPGHSGRANIAEIGTIFKDGMCQWYEGRVMTNLSVKDLLPLWWAIYWRWSIICGIVGGIAGGLAGFVAGLMGFVESGGTVGGIAGWLVGMPVSLIVLKMALNLEYSTLNIVIEKKLPVES